MSLEFELSLHRRNFEINLNGKYEKGITGVFGPSGAGKTTFFMLLAGLLKPASGRIVLNGRTIVNTAGNYYLPVNKRRIGVVFQQKLLFPHLSIKQNLCFGERYSGRPAVSFDTIVEMLDLSRVLDSKPNQISGGEQQRAAIGRALLTSPDLLLLDEPFNAVDSSLRKNILLYLKRLRNEFDIPILVISHDLPDLQRLTDKIQLIENGRSSGYGNIIDLISEKPDFSEDYEMVNTFDMICREELENGLFSCSFSESPEKRIHTAAAPDRSFTMVIKPDKIALSKHFVPDISIQNQLEGRITKIINIKNYTYCMVDAGTVIVSKITNDSYKKLKLRTGENVYCLFKTHSLSL